ncbi:MAG: YlbF family regulator [Eubacterium sp.]|nr:YlbF family regulator [Eubacterium sp.]
MSLETALRELGKEIQKDERFIKLQACAKANDADEELQKKMQELQLLSLKFQQEMQKGEEADKDRITELQTEYQTQYNEVMQTPNMMNYSVAASEMEQVAQYISSMIGLFFEGQDPETCEPPAPEDCTHDCSTCGGCH